MVDTSELNPIWGAIIVAIVGSIYIQRLPEIDPVLLVAMFAVSYLVLRND